MDITHEDYCDEDHTEQEHVEAEQRKHMGLAVADPVWVAAL